MAEEAQAKDGREGLEVPGLGQLGHQALRICHKEALLARAWAQVEVQAALKALVHILCICRHLPINTQSDEC